MRYTIKQFQREFPNDDVCLDYIFKARFGKDYLCPKCAKTGFYRVNSRKCYACKCGYQIHPTTGTIFHKSSTKITDWFFAIYLMSQSKNGVSAKELERHLGCTYKCAWRIANKIRTLMKQDNNMLEGVVEADETFIGGKREGKQYKGGVDKISIMGMVERKGKIRSKVIPDRQTHTLLKELRECVKFGSHLITDDYAIYNKVNRIGLFHDSVNHSKREFARGNVHTNTIEGFWGQMKRSISGTYHCVSEKYLQSYVDEFAYHYNHNYSVYPVFYDLLSRLCGQHDLGGQRMPSFVGVPVS